MFPLEAFRETLGKATRLFNLLDIPFHLTGGITSIAYGEPRMTQDLDIVVCPQAITRRLPEFLTALARSDFLHNEDAIRSAVNAREMFRLLDLVEVLKLDVYPREMIPGELQHRIRQLASQFGLVPLLETVLAEADELSSG